MKNLNVPQRTLTDIRDGETYRVRKLADGNIWMTENLRLVGSRVLKSSDSDVVTDYTLPTSSTDGWCTDYTDASCTDRSLLLYSGNSDYGTYYNWYTMTAGTGTYNLDTLVAASSVCARGWKLPTGDGSESAAWVKLSLSYPDYSVTAWRDNPVSLVLGGYYDGNNIRGQNSFGMYGSSTNGIRDFDDLHYYNTAHLDGDVSISFSVVDLKTTASPIRCIAK